MGPITNAVAGIGLALWQLLGFAPAPAPAVNRTPAVCTTNTATDAVCLAKIYARSDGRVVPAVTAKALPAGYSPAQLRSAYGAPANGTGRIAVVTAYDDPFAKSDLDTYSNTFGLPVLPNCTTAAQTACFEKFNQTGGTIPPLSNRAWALETALDVQTAHAVCPGCRLTLVEASSASITNLMSAVDTAVAKGARVVSMSWGAGEFAQQTVYAKHFNVPGVIFAAASGDDGLGTSWPAASANVLSVGGTTLKLTAAGARASETTWSGTGSGCSLYEAKPAWQHDDGCAKRTLNDLAAVADPATGAAIYTSYSNVGRGWFVVGGTSLATPLVAAMVAAAGGGNQAAIYPQLYAAQGSANLFDVTTGSNGACSPQYLCGAGTGFDGPTGNGTPVGLAAL
ncbi:MAG TPA: S53 family peptidase [Candidatus Saccharimonadia bacterium]